METLGHRLFAFLELEYCEGGDLHGLMLGESKRVGGWRQRGAERGAESVVDARNSQGTVGLPVAQIGRLVLGLCEGVQQLHEVWSQESVIFTLREALFFFRGMLPTERRAQSSYDPPIGYVFSGCYPRSCCTEYSSCQVCGEVPARNVAFRCSDFICSSPESFVDVQLLQSC